MSEEPQAKRKRPTRRSDPRTLKRFVQEFTWLLSSYEDLDFKALSSLIERVDDRRLPSFVPEPEQASPAASLVGSLPDLFTDEALFPSNEDIADFAAHALGVVIPRWSKKSKYEIIGHVVCHTSVAGEQRLAQVVEAMERITANREKAREMISKNKERGMTWNELIQQLNEQ